MRALKFMWNEPADFIAANGQIPPFYGNIKEQMPIGEEERGCLTDTVAFPACSASSWGRSIGILKKKRTGKGPCGPFSDTWQRPTTTRVRLSLLQRATWIYARSWA